jgi:hypothetical protein
MHKLPPLLPLYLAKINNYAFEDFLQDATCNADVEFFDLQENFEGINMRKEDYNEDNNLYGGGGRLEELLLSLNHYTTLSKS